MEQRGKGTAWQNPACYIRTTPLKRKPGTTSAPHMNWFTHNHFCMHLCKLLDSLPACCAVAPHSALPQQTRLSNNTFVTSFSIPLQHPRRACLLPSTAEGPAHGKLCGSTTAAMGNSCVKPPSLGQVEADIGQPDAAYSSPPSAAAVAAAAVASKASSKAGGSIPASPPSPRPPAGSKGPSPSPRPAQHKQCCFAEGPATQWQIHAAEPGPAQPQQP